MRPDPNILLAANLLLANATNVANARAHLRHERRLIDGLPSIASGADTGGGSQGERTIPVKYRDADDNEQTDHVPVTGVEAAMFQRQQLDDRLADLDAHVRGVLTMANDIHRTTQRILATRIEVPRCSATGRDGAIIWGRPDCTNVPSRGPLCDSCARRETRFRQERNLPSRSDGLFSGGDAA